MAAMIYNALWADISLAGFTEKPQRLLMVLAKQKLFPDLELL